MRLLAAIAAALLLAGCASDDADGADPGPDGGGPSGTPTPDASPTPDPDAGDQPPNGFCGPPQCSPCPAQHSLNAELAQGQDARDTVVWDDMPAANRTAVLAALLADALDGTPASVDDSQANVTREMRNLYDGYAATHGGAKGEGAGGLNPIVVVEDGQRVLFSISAIVC